MFTRKFVKRNEREKREEENEDDMVYVFLTQDQDMCYYWWTCVLTILENEKYTSHESDVTDKVRKCVISLKAKKYFLIANK